MAVCNIPLCGLKIVVTFISKSTAYRSCSSSPECSSLPCSAGTPSSTQDATAEEEIFGEEAEEEA
ncbi:hypothetical protein J1605_006995 [Eschrichtius robustus]|uniref:Uncharacterized protein n=1 Tax=Eschrichtius robustus TaxID=9764 RepID=A0AB34H1S9_ESCRO|nr:hypothetical protein J1605_006995 [Eschrichtius robustus]